MARGLIVIEKEQNGEVWSNVWGFSAPGGDVFGNLDDAGLAAVGADSAVGPDGQLVAGDVSLLRSLLDFERRLVPSFVKFRQVYVTDGLYRDPAVPNDNNAFYVATLSYTGDAANNVAEGDVVPGSVALQINKNPAGFSERRGRCFIRGKLVDLDVRFGGVGLVDWLNPARRDVVTGQVQAAVDASGLDNYMFNGDNNEQALLCIPKYRNATTAQGRKGDLYETVPIRSLSVVGPVSRQVKRGRRNAA